MRIPFQQLKPDGGRESAEIKAAIDGVIERGMFILGSETTAFEEEWARYCGCAAAAGVGNGTDALALALKASGAVEQGRRDEVITTPLTAGYTALAILNAGGVPVYADIDPRTLNLDPGTIESRITKRTCAIVPVHLYGQMADMPAIRDIADRYGLTIVEDAAHAHGARLHGKGPGEYSDAAAFSFYPTKNLGALGDAGAVVSKDARLIDQVKTLRQGAHPGAVDGQTMGRNSRLDELQAAVLRVRLRYLERANIARRRLARSYDTWLKDVPGLILPQITEPEAHVHHLYVMQHPRRERLRSYLASQGIETMIHYSALLHQQRLFREPRPTSYPNAERVAKQILSLPLHPRLAAAEVAEIAQHIQAFESTAFDVRAARSGLTGSARPATAENLGGDLQSSG